MTARAERGFSLIEIMAALAIFGIVAVMAQQALMLAIRSESRVSERRAALALLQRAVTQMARDIENIAPRAVGNEPAMIVAEGALTLTRGGTPNPAGLLRSGFQRVRYALSEEGLERTVWRVLDPAPDQSPHARTLLPGATGFRVRVWSGGAWQGAWPGIDPSPVLPRGVETEIDTDTFGTVRRVVSLP